MNVVMTVNRLKDTYVQVRIREDVKAELEIVAESQGLSMSALIRRLIAKEINQEKRDSPHFFESGREMALLPKTETDPDDVAAMRKRIDKHKEGGD